MARFFFGSGLWLVMFRKGVPLQFAQEALGHNSKAVHRAYARKAKVKLPSLESYEKQAAEGQIIQLHSTPRNATERKPCLHPLLAVIAEVRLVAQLCSHQIQRESYWILPCRALLEVNTRSSHSAPLLL